MKTSEAIASLKTLCNTCTMFPKCVNNKPECFQAIEMAISALKKQEQDRWIPCKERLPEEDGQYLVTYESGYAEDYGFVDPIGIAPFEVDCEGFGIWQESFDHVSLGSLGSDWIDIPVTAWRPLPKPYTEEEA